MSTRFDNTKPVEKQTESDKLISVSSCFSEDDCNESVWSIPR